MLSRDAAIRDIGEMSHLAVEGGQVVGAELAEVRVASRTRQHGHQFRGGGKELVEPLRRVIEGEPSPKLRFFGRDPDRGIVQRACPHPDTTDRLHGRIGHRHRIRPQSQGLCEVGVGAQSADQVAIFTFCIRLSPSAATAPGRIPVVAPLGWPPASRGAAP